MCKTPRRRMVEIAVVLLLLAGWGERFSPAACGQHAIPVAANAATDVEGILGAGYQLEQQGRWGEALSLYQQAVKDHPTNPQLDQRRSLARIHFDLHRRYSDSKYLQTLRTTDGASALDVYSEVLLKIQSYYVDPPDWAVIARHGLIGLEIALDDPEFREQNLSGIDTTQIESAKRQLRDTLEQYTVYRRQDAYAVASSAARLMSRLVNLPAQYTVYEFVCGAIASLDPYSAFLTSSQYEETMSQIEGNFVGLGVELKTHTDHLEIVSVIADGPAGRAGVKSGSRILAVDGQTVAQLGGDKAADLLRGIEGSLVTISVVGPLGQAFDVRLQRKRVDIPSVDQVRMVDPENGIGYVRIASFQKTTLRDFDQALWQLQRQGLRSLIVDVRDNPGGLLSAAVDVADRFVSSGVIVSTKGRNPLEDFVHRANLTGTWRIPVNVLVDEHSASASEIFAAALQDNRRATLIGQRSYGKGSVQGIFALGTGGGVRLTTAKFYSPRGIAISQRGVVPDVVVHQVARPSDQAATADNTDIILRTAIGVAQQQLAGQSLVGR